VLNDEIWQTNHKEPEMLVERQEQKNLFETLLPFTLADQDSTLTRIDVFLDKHPDILLTFTTSLKTRSRKSQTMGRPSEPAEAILRMLILRRLYSQSFRQTCKAVNDSLVLRQFTRIYYESVPDYSTLAKYDQLLTEDLLKKLNRHIVLGAKEQKVTKGKKLRMDTTVVEANIHYPTDSHLLYDSIRVLSRLAHKCRQAGIASGEVTRNFTRSAKKQLLKIIKFARSRSEEGHNKFKRTYQTMIEIGKRSLVHARQLVSVHLKDTQDKTLKHIVKQFQRFIPLVERVIEQTRRRVLDGQMMPNTEKLISIFQPDCYVIRKGKRAKPNEFGKLLEIQQCDGKIITNWNIHATNVSDTGLFIPAIESHINLFGKPPRLACGDRGFYSEENETSAQQHGVKRVCLPKRGKKSKSRCAHEKQAWFKSGFAFRAGLEGSISVLKRRHGFDRCLNVGVNAYQRWTGMGIIANNLLVIAKT